MITLLAMACLGQTPTFMAYDLRVKHQVVLPGQVQEIEVWASFTPIWTPIYPGAVALMFALAEVDLVNVFGYNTGVMTDFGGVGTVAWSGSPGPDGGRVGMGAFNPEFGLSNFNNPIYLMKIEWTPDPLLGPRTVEIATQVRGDYFHNIWLIQYPPNFPSYVQWETTEVFNDSVSWKVIPAPAAALVLIEPLVLARRRRGARAL